jgi:hypothetical protein
MLCYAFPLYGRKRQLSEQVGTLYFGLGAAEHRNCLNFQVTAELSRIKAAPGTSGSE